MPPGYTAFFLWVASAVLWWSGWREETADGVPDFAVAVFLAGWPFAAWMDLPFSEHLSVNGAFVWTGLAMIALIWRMDSPVRWTALSAGFLLGSLTLLLAFSPWLSIHLPDGVYVSAIAALIGVAACLLVQGAAGQAASITLAMSVPDLWKAAWLHESGRAGIGSGLWMESWWIAVISARALSAMAAAVRINVLGIGWRREREGS